MASDPPRTVKHSMRAQPNITPSSSSKPTEPYTLETIYNEAMLEVETLHASGKLPQVYYDILKTTTTPQDLLSIVDGENQRRMQKQPQYKHALYSAVSSTVKRLDRYAGAIDMLAQSSPQAFGLNVVGLIWGSLKLLLVVAQDVINTFEMVVQTVKDVESSLPVFETLTQIYGSSEIQLLRQPFIDVYKAVISLGLWIVRLCESGSLCSLGRSSWTSLQGQFKGNVAELTRAGQLIDRTAQVEHMYTSEEVRKTVDIESGRQENFRREIRRNMRQPVERGPRNPIRLCNTAPLGFLAPHFTGRAEDLAKLKLALGRRSDGLPARCSVVGMPGLGKTQLALKYTSLTFDPLNGPMVLWSSAATTEKLTLGYSEILDLVDHVDRDHTDQGLKLRTARRCLESAGQEQALPWLLIFDNVNEDTVPFLREYLPQTNENVAILFTMRSNDVAKALINPTSSAESQAILYLEVPNLNDAKDLLLAELEAPNESDTTSQIAKAETLVKLVGYLPLAINQVASFAQQHSKDLDYILGVYQGQQDMDIMKWDNQLSTYEQRSVMSAFSSTLDELAKASPVASLLLQTLSFFDPESIPLDMIVAGAYPIRDLRAYSEARKPELSEPPMPKRRLMQKLQHKLLSRLSKASKVDPIYTGYTVSIVDLNDQRRYDSRALEMSELLENRVKCPDAIQQLRRLAFIAYHSDTDGETIRIHDLVRSMVRYNARQNDFDPICYRMAAAIVHYALCILDSPWLQTHSWLQYEKILPHYRSIALFHEAQEGCNIEVVRASNEVVDYLTSRGRRDEAVRTIEVMIPVQQKCLGRMNVDSLKTLSHLAKAHSYQGHHQKAEDLMEQIFNAREAMLGATHEDTLASMTSLAVIYNHQGKYEEATSLQEKVVSITKRRFGTDHPRTLLAQRKLGKVYELSGRFVEAEMTLEEVLRSTEKTLGTSHLDTLFAVEDLGMFKHKLQRSDEADVLLRRALAGLFREFDSEPLFVLDIEEKLGILRQHQGNFVEAEVLLKACLAALEKQFGMGNKETIFYLENLAWLYIEMQRFVDAEVLLRRAVGVFDESEESESYENHFYVALAFTVEQQSRLAEAEGLYRKVWDEVSQDPDSQIVSAMTCAKSLSRVLYAQEHKREADILHERASNYLEGALTWLYRRGIYDTNCYWHELVTIGRVLEDEEMCKIALKVQEEKIGFTHPVTQRTLQALVAILHEKGKTEEEKTLVQRCKREGLELRLPEEAEAPGPGGGDNEQKVLGRMRQQYK